MHSPQPGLYALREKAFLMEVVFIKRLCIITRHDIRKKLCKVRKDWYLNYTIAETKIMKIITLKSTKEYRY